jgi:hypothetical protein
MGRQKPAQLYPETVSMYSNKAGHILYTLCRPTNSTQGGTEKDWGLKTGDWRPGPGSPGQTNGRTDRRNDEHFLPPLQTSQSRTRVYNPRTDGWTRTLKASRDRGQYDCYITVIEIGNNRKLNKFRY